MSKKDKKDGGKKSKDDLSLEWVKTPKGEMPLADALEQFHDPKKVEVGKMCLKAAPEVNKLYGNRGGEVNLAGFKEKGGATYEAVDGTWAAIVRKKPSIL